MGLAWFAVSSVLSGTAEQVTQRMIDLHEAGADGIALSWVNFDEGLEQMEAQILPMLVQAGLRRPATVMGD